MKKLQIEFKSGTAVLVNSKCERFEQGIGEGGIIAVPPNYPEESTSLYIKIKDSDKVRLFWRPLSPKYVALPVVECKP